MGGGGFMSGGGSADDDNKVRGGYKNQTLRPVTIKQLTEIPVHNADMPIILDNEEIKQVTFVGVVRNIVSHSIHTIYTIEDGTGTIDVRVWANGGNNGDGEMGDEEGAGQRSETIDPNINVGRYVRVYGEFKFFNSKRHVSAHKVRPVTDHNEITYHGLEATHVHLTKTRGAAPKNVSAMGVPSSAGQQGSSGGDAYGMGGAYSSGYSGGGSLGGGMSMNPLQAAVLEVITQTPQDANGVPKSVVQQKLAGKFQSGDVSNAVEWLISEGHLYNTIDDSHVRSTAH
ncbi:hypothetical protein BX070DRAFT_144392 [Coemansia spiralis]|nr:hypothetical protein BX070DRAFT_144392 [Coemansia spiralis]